MGQVAATTATSLGQTVPHFALQRFSRTARWPSPPPRAPASPGLPRRSSPSLTGRAGLGSPAASRLFPSPGRTYPAPRRTSAPSAHLRLFPPTIFGSFRAASPPFASPPSPISAPPFGSFRLSPPPWALAGSLGPLRGFCPLAEVRIHVPVIEVWARHFPHILAINIINF